MANRYLIDKDKSNDENIEDVREFIKGEREVGNLECEIDLGKGVVQCNVGIPAADYARAQGWIVRVTFRSRVMTLVRSLPWPEPEGKVDGRKKSSRAGSRSSKYKSRVRGAVGK